MLSAVFGNQGSTEWLSSIFCAKLERRDVWGLLLTGHNHSIIIPWHHIIIYTTRLYASWFLSLKHFPFRMLQREKQAAVGRSVFSTWSRFNYFNLNHSESWPSPAARNGSSKKTPTNMISVPLSPKNKVVCQQFALPQLYTTTPTKYHFIIYQQFDILILICTLLVGYLLSNKNKNTGTPIGSRHSHWGNQWCKCCSSWWSTKYTNW